MLDGVSRTGASAHSHALAAGKFVAIAHEIRGRVCSVTVIQKPAKVVGCGAQPRELPWAKEFLILGRWPAMRLVSCHASKMTHRVLKIFSLEQ